MICTLHHYDYDDDQNTIFDWSRDKGMGKKHVTENICTRRVLVEQPQETRPSEELGVAGRKTLNGS
jgi:hypothetical protein